MFIGVGLVVGWLCAVQESLSLPAAPAPERSASVEANRYSRQWIANLRYSLTGSLMGPQRMACFGVFVELIPGETLELVALRSGRSPAVLRAINRHAEGAPSPGEYLCLSYFHRCLPSETLASIAEYYETDAQTLGWLNDLEVGEEPSPWSRIVVPIEWHPDALPCFKVPVPNWGAFAVPAGSKLKFSHRFRMHQASEGDTWDELAAKNFATAEILRSVHISRFPRRRGRGDAEVETTLPEQELKLEVGTDYKVGLLLELTEAITAEGLAVYLEYFLRVDLDEILRDNDCAAMAELMKLDQVFVPFSCEGGFP